MAEFLISAFADETSNDPDHQIAALKRNGLRMIEPRNIGGGIVDRTDAELDAFADKLDRAGIGISALGSPIGKYDIDKPFDAHLTVFRRALEICRRLGTNRMRMFSFFVPQERLKECRAEVLRRLSVMLEEADRAGVTLCHENESKIYGQNPAEVADLLNALPGLYGVFDAANYVMNDADPLAGIEATLIRPAYLHMKDAIGAEKAIVPVGMGDGRYEKVLRRVDRAMDGLVYLTVEPHLHIFEIYQRIDSHKLKTGIAFDNSDDAFDCAVSAVKKLLTGLGYKEGADLIWRK